MTSLIITISLVLFSFVAINIYFRIADKYNIVDKPNHRSSHIHITIRGGGIIFPLCALIGLAMMPTPDYFTMAGILLLACISFWDDVKNISTSIRFLAQIVSVVLLFLSTGEINYWVALGLLPVFLGFLNGYNFMDGINGITGLYSITVLASLWYININISTFIEPNFFLYLMVPIFVFLFYNLRPKAKCFAGDIGSITIAYVIAYLFYRLIIFTHNPLYLLFLCVYGIDISFTIIKRLSLGHNILEPHRMHLYQVLANEAGIAHVKVSLLYAVIQLVINVVLFAIIHLKLHIILTLVIGLLALLSISYIILKKQIFSRATQA